MFDSVKKSTIFELNKKHPSCSLLIAWISFFILFQIKKVPNARFINISSISMSLYFTFLLIFKIIKDTALNQRQQYEYFKVLAYIWIVALIIIIFLKCHTIVKEDPEKYKNNIDVK